MSKQLFVLFYLITCSQLIFAQKNLKIIKANSNKTYFIEGKSKDKSNWYLDPSIKLDVYETDKTSKAKWISFHTDIESFKLKIKPGEKYNFVVLLNGKDSCYNQIYCKAPIKKYKELSPSIRDTIPFELTDANNIKIQVLLNNKDTLDMHFDTGGSSGLVLTHESIANKTNLLVDEKEGFKTKDYQVLRKLSSMRIGNMHWDGLAIYPVSISPDGTDGHFGWDLFDGRVVELDYENEIMVIHSSLSKIPKGYTKLDIEYVNGIFCVKGKLKANGKRFKNRFLFDTGYQRAIVLDSVLMEEQNFPKEMPAIKTTKLKNGQGTVFVTRIVNGDKMKLGKYSLNDVPLQLLSVPNPARFKTNILGNELLKRFNTILDFQNNYVYLKPNNLMTLPYIDAS